MDSEVVGPSVEGYTPLRHLGSGGFAEVHLYQERMPSRAVAIKILNATAREAFAQEANAMAMISAHPAVVTIYGIGVLADDRPYIAMEYCPGLNFRELSKESVFSVRDVLRTGVRIADAVEMAHRVGILHRDVKPANILMSAFGEPTLTDFGISMIAQDGSASFTGEALGISVPWAAPELLGDAPYASVRSDVYSIGASLYTLLSGRAPFEVTYGSNKQEDLIARISAGALAEIDREGVPPALTRIIRTAMSVDPARRQSSALELALELQGVEAYLGLAPTRITVPDQSYLLELQALAATLAVAEPAEDPELSFGADELDFDEQETPAPLGALPAPTTVMPVQRPVAPASNRFTELFRAATSWGDPASNRTRRTWDERAERSPEAAAGTLLASVADAAQRPGHAPRDFAFDALVFAPSADRSPEAAASLDEPERLPSGESLGAPTDRRPGVPRTRRELREARRQRDAASD